MKQIFANNAATTLQSQLLVADSTISLLSGTGFPSPAANEYFLVTLQQASQIEIISVSARSTNSLTILARGLEGTTAQIFAAGAQVEVRVTSATLGGFTNALNSLASINLLTTPTSTPNNVNSYITGSLDPFGNPITVIARNTTTWNFLNYSLMFSGVVSTTSGTTNASGTGFLVFTSTGTNQYIIQFTSGALAGQARTATGSTATATSWTTATSVAPSNGDTFEIYQNNNSILGGLGNLNVYSLLMASTTLAAADSGKTFGVTTGTITLPTPATGLHYRIIGSGSGAGTLAYPSGSIYLPDGTITNSLAIGFMTTIDVFADGTSWLVYNTSGEVITKSAVYSNNAVPLGQANNLYQASLGAGVVPVQQGNISTQVGTTIIHIGQSVADNTRVKLAVGAADKGNIVLENDNNTFSGTNTFNNPLSVGTATLGGHAITLYQANVAYAGNNIAVKQGKNTIWVPAGAMVSRLTSGAVPGTLETSSNKVMYKTMDFGQAGSAYAQFKIRMPKSWNGGILGATFVWTATSGTGAVTWFINCTPLVDGVLDANFGTSVSQNQGVVINNVNTTPETAGFTPTGTYSNATEPTITFQIYRTGTSGTDTLNATASLIGVSIS